MFLILQNNLKNNIHFLALIILSVTNVGANLCVRPLLGRHTGLPLQAISNDVRKFFFQKIDVLNYNYCFSRFPYVFVPLFGIWLKKTVRSGEEIIESGFMMIKVAVVIPKYGLVGGAEGFVYALTERLAMRNEFEIHVFANRWRRGKAPILFHKVPILVFPRFMKQISFAWFVNRQIQRGAYDLIHSHDRIFSMDLFTLHGIPHKTWIRQMRHKRLSLFDRAMAWVERKGLTGPPVPMVLPVSSLVKNELQRRYPVSEDHIEVIHPGVNLERFSKLDKMRCRREIRNCHGIDEEDLVILFVGMNFEIKRLGLIIESMSRISPGAVASEVKLLVVGKGKAAPYLAMAREYGVADRIIFAGVTRRLKNTILQAIFLPCRQFTTPSAWRFWKPWPPGYP